MHTLHAIVGREARAARAAGAARCVTHRDGPGTAAGILTTSGGPRHILTTSGGPRHILTTSGGPRHILTTSGGPRHNPCNFYISPVTTTRRGQGQILQRRRPNPCPASATVTAVPTRTLRRIAAVTGDVVAAVVAP
jgi:hypothetical protein